MSAAGYPDWQRYAVWFGEPLVEADALALGAGTHIDSALQAPNFSSVVLAVKPTGGKVTATLEQSMQGAPAALVIQEQFIVNSGQTLFEAIVLLGNILKLTLTGDTAGETVAYALVPTNTTSNAQVITNATIDVQLNDALVAAEPTLDFEDSSTVTWAVVDDPTNTRVKLTPSAGAILDGWVTPSGTFAYSSADGPTGVITTSVDLSGTIPLGARVKYVQSATTKYGIVTAIGAGTITIYGGTDYTTTNVAITGFRYSLAKVPLGFNPDPRKWTVEVTDNAARVQVGPVSGTWYNLGSIQISVPIGLWRVNFQVSLQCDTGAGESNVLGTLSTANNNITDVDLLAALRNYDLSTASSSAISTVNRNKVISTAAKTTYYLNAMSTGAGTIAFAGNFADTIIRAECAYL